MHLQPKHTRSNVGRYQVVQALLEKEEKTTAKQFAEQIASLRYRHVLFISLAVFVFLNAVAEIIDITKPFTAIALDAARYDLKGVESNVTSSQRASDVVLLGSSLLLDSMWSVDQPFGANKTDGSHYHHAVALEKALAEADRKLTVGSMAVAGAMLSDSYLLISHYMERHARPKYVVLDCAPRSFYDGRYVAPNSTPIFNSCFTLSDLLIRQKPFTPNFQDQLDLLCRRVCFMYRNRAALADYAWTALQSDGSFSSNANKSVPVEHSQLKSVSNDDAVSTKSKFDRSLADYKNRYHWINLPQMAVHFDALSRISELCRKHHSQLILVFMPLSVRNEKLLPDGFHAQFKELATATAGPDVEILDLTNSGENLWDDSNFSDSVHLNADGARRFIKDLVRLFSRLPQSAETAGVNP